MTQSLWDLAGQQVNQNKNTCLNVERTLVFAGTKNSGKTTIINKLIKKDEQTKPSVVLEYIYGRRSIGPYSVGESKSIVHLWELGGGMEFSNLLDITVTIENIENLAFCIVFDLSKPNQIWNTLIHFLEVYKQRLKLVFERISKKCDILIQKILNAIQSRIEFNNFDKELIENYPVPLVLIGTKYDEFSKLDQFEKDLIINALRFVAHTYTGALFFVNLIDGLSTKDLLNYLKYLAFNVSDKKASVFSQNKRLSFLPGQDSFSNIGLPSFEIKSLKLGERNPLSLWEAGFCQIFPQILTSSDDTITRDDKSSWENFVELAIDEARMVKDDEFELHRKQSEKRIREQLHKAANDGLIIV